MNTIYAALLLLTACAFVPSPAQARLAGEVELGYITYDSQVNGAKRDARSFQQRYSLLYDNAGLLANGRLGKYKYALGYEWGSVDTKVTTSSGDSNPSISTGHLLFGGEILVAPKTLPLRLTAFSHDLNRIRFQSDVVSALNDGDNIITPNVTDNLQDGTRISSGATLWLGLKNEIRQGGSDVFDKIPYFMVDYRDEYVRDLKSLSPEHTRIKKLAFVSLNKRDNWFHYRMTRAENYIDSSQSFKEDQYILGTVDHRMERRWIDLTNWIKISADGQFTKRADQQAGDSQAYDLNLFAVATREKWEARTFNNFNRTLDRQGLTTKSQVPIYLSGVWGTETDWQARLTSNQEKTIALDKSLSDRNSLLASLRVKTFNRSQFTLSPSVTLERVEQNLDRTIAAEMGVETTSTRRFSDVFGVAASYNVKVINQEGTTNASYLEQALTGRGIYRVSSRFRIELEERFTTGSGTRGQQVDTTITSSQGAQQVVSSTTFRTRDATTDGFNRFVTTLTTAWTPLARLKVGFTASEDVFKPSNGDTDVITAFGNTIDYTLPTFAIGSNVSYRTRSVGGVRSYDVNATGRASYTPNRNLKASLRYTYSQVHESDSDSTNVDLVQNFTYTVFRYGGMGQRLLDFTQELSYENSGAGATASQFTSKKRLTLGVKYYPIRNVFVAATARYSLLDPGNEKEWMGNGTVGAVFSKLQATIDYSYGRRENGDNRIEKRFAANLKKQF